MIEMIAGVFGLPIKGANGNTIRIKGMGPNDGPFSVTPEREAELVEKGIARYVHNPVADAEAAYVPDDAPIGFDETPPEDEAEVVEEIIDLETLTAKELRELGKEYGLTFKANASKAHMIKAITEVQSEVEDDDLEDVPSFDAAEAVEE